MKYKLVVVGILCILAFNAKAIAADQPTGSEHKSATVQGDEKQKVYYTCPMDPEVKSDKPGKRPKCGMNLEKVEPKEEKK